MKKLKVLLVVVLLGFMVTGCGTEEEKTMTCTRTLNQQGMKMNLKYTVVYQGDYVKRVKSVEKVTSEDASILKAMQESVEKQYEPYQTIDHYDTNVTIEGNTMTSTAEINYEKIDVSKLTEIDSASGKLFTDGKLKVDTLESLYNQVGATCTK